MEYYNVFTKHTYKVLDQDNERWYRVGSLKITPNGGRFLKLFHQPDTTFYVLPKEEAALPEVD